MSYWDTSALVKLYAKESDSAAFEKHAMLSAGPIVTSRIGLYEARATFLRKEIDGTLQPNGASTLYARLAQDAASGQLQLVDLSVEVEREYGLVLELCYRSLGSSPIALRTLDAL